MGLNSLFQVALHLPFYAWQVNYLITLEPEIKTALQNADGVTVSSANTRRFTLSCPVSLCLVRKHAPFHSSRASTRAFSPFSSVNECGFRGLNPL